MNHTGYHGITSIGGYFLSFSSDADFIPVPQIFHGK